MPLRGNPNCAPRHYSDAGIKIGTEEGVVPDMAGANLIIDVAQPLVRWFE
jgi:hypothetical protein